MENITSERYEQLMYDINDKIKEIEEMIKQVKEVYASYGVEFDESLFKGVI